MAKKAFVKHHYIPKFILRSFCFEEEDTWLFDKKTQAITKTGISNIFMKPDLYRDDSYPDPVWVEKDFSTFENKASAIIKKLRDDNVIRLTEQEKDLLELFLATLGFRSDRIGNAFKNADPETRAMYEVKTDEELLELWKRNLGWVAGCQSIREVMVHEKIDPLIKAFMMKDVFGLFGKSLLVVERCGEEDFFLSDAYPTDVTFSRDDSTFKFPGYSIFPISPHRAIILFATGVEGVPADVLEIEKRVFKGHRLVHSSGLIKVFIERVYEPDVKKLNRMMYNATEQSIIFKDRGKISIDEYPKMIKR